MNVVANCFYSKQKLPVRSSALANKIENREVGRNDRAIALSKLSFGAAIDEGKEETAQKVKAFQDKVISQYGKHSGWAYDCGRQLNFEDGEKLNLTSFMRASSKIVMINPERNQAVQIEIDADGNIKSFSAPRSLARLGNFDENQLKQIDEHYAKGIRTYVNLLLDSAIENPMNKTYPN